MVKLVLMGTNIILHKYVCAYTAVHEGEPELLKGVDLRIYVCPEGGNCLGRFLAWNDKVRVGSVAERSEAKRSGAKRVRANEHHTLLTPLSFPPL